MSSYAGTPSVRLGEVERIWKVVRSSHPRYVEPVTKHIHVHSDSEAVSIRNKNKPVCSRRYILIGGKLKNKSSTPEDENETSRISQMIPE